jgi:hypothetical protein
MQEHALTRTRYFCSLNVIISHPIVYKEGLDYLSVCVITSRSFPPSHVCIFNGHPSSELFCCHCTRMTKVHLKKVILMEWGKLWAAQPIDSLHVKIGYVIWIFHGVDSFYFGLLCSDTVHGASNLSNIPEDMWTTRGDSTSTPAFGYILSPLL